MDQWGLHFYLAEHSFKCVRTELHAYLSRKYLISLVKAVIAIFTIPIKRYRSKPVVYTEIVQATVKCAPILKSYLGSCSPDAVAQIVAEIHMWIAWA